VEEELANRMKKPRILMLSKGLARYRYTFTEHLAEALADRAEIMACPLGEDLWEVDFPALKQACGLVRYTNFPHSWAALDALAPDLLCIMEYPPAMLNALAWAKLRRVPVVVSTEVGAGEPVQQDIRLHTKLLHRLMAHFTCGQIAFSPAARTAFGARHRPVLFSPHSIDTTEFTARSWTSISQQKITLLTVAQYHPRKGLDLMAAALAPLKELHDFEWRIIGILDPSWLQQVIQSHGLEGQSVITGPIQGQQLITEFQKADLFVLPSRFDTYGVVTQEAAACGLPLLISRYAGSSENLVNDGLNGWRIDPHDTTGFTATLNELMSHPDRWSAMGQASRTVAQQWCVRKNAQRAAAWLQQWLPAPLTTA
jgi:glycosyltransferase involved in cell wall biosynthesis